MTWLTALLAVAVAVAALAFLGLQPKKGRQVSHTSLMGVARAVLIIAVVLVAFFAYYFRAGA